MQVFNSKENIGDLTKLSATSVRLAPSVVTVGGQQFSTGILDCDLTTNGAGGLDIGSEQSGKYYYVYAVLDSGSPALICSLSNIKPTGYTSYKKVGAFVNDFNGDVEQVLNVGDQPITAIEFRGSNAVVGNRLRINTLFSVKGIGAQYTDDGVNATVITILEDGSWNTGFNFSALAFGAAIAIFKNAAIGLSPNSAANQTEALQYGNTGSNAPDSISFSGELLETDQITYHTSNPASAGTNGQSHRGYITKVDGKAIDWKQYKD